MGSSTARVRRARHERGRGPPNDPGGLFGPTVVRWFTRRAVVRRGGFADLLRSTSVYRRLDPAVREPLLEAIAERMTPRWQPSRASLPDSVLPRGPAHMT